MSLNPTQIRATAYLLAADWLRADLAEYPVQCTEHGAARTKAEARKINEAIGEIIRELERKGRED